MCFQPQAPVGVMTRVSWVRRQCLGVRWFLMNAGLTHSNNLGPTLLITLGLGLLPLVLGMPLILFGLSRLRAVDGRRTFADLAPF